MPKFIFTADWHIRPDTPRCRKDEDWVETQRKQVDFVMDKAFAENCPLIIAGDIFHKPQVPDYFKSMLTLRFFDWHVYALAGNHDLPHHSFDKIDDSSFGVLFNSGVIDAIPESLGCYSHFGHILKYGNEELVFLHEPIFASEADCPPNMKAKTAIQVMEEYPDAKWIFCGDIHRGFHFKMQGRHLIMAGCLNRQTSDMIDYTPVIWFIDTDKEIIEAIPVPDDVNMVTDAHIQQKNAKDDRIQTFVSSIKDSKTVTLDFAENVNKAMAADPDLTEGVRQTIEELMEA